jgi:hypothetical protein
MCNHCLAHREFLDALDDLMGVDFQVTPHQNHQAKPRVWRGKK